MKRVRIHVRVLPLWNPCVAAFDASSTQAASILGVATLINKLAKKAVFSVEIAEG